MLTRQIIDKPDSRYVILYEFTEDSVERGDQARAKPSHAAAQAAKELPSRGHASRLQAADTTHARRAKPSRRRTGRSRRRR